LVLLSQTQLTTHKRPTLPKIYDDEFLESSTTNKDEEDEMAKIGLDSNDATTTQALFGTAPPGQETLYDFYKQQISALVQSQAAMADSAFESKPVIVGLSLALPSTQQDMQDDDGDFAEVADSERHRFEAILNLVRQASVW
jgi:hypothetical protein